MTTDHTIIPDPAALAREAIEHIKQAKIALAKAGAAYADANDLDKMDAVVELHHDLALLKLDEVDPGPFR